MTVISELMKKEDDGTLSFGDYTLPSKTKLADFEYKGDLMKVKTFKEITKLEKNGMFVYESVPGTAVSHMEMLPYGMQFQVSGTEDTQITLGLEEGTEYHVILNHKDIGIMKTNMGGKLSFSVELSEDQPMEIKVSR